MKFLSFLLVLSIVAMVAAFGSQYGPGEWYSLIDKPSWTPPNSVFAPVWLVLYFTMAIAAWQVLQEKHPVGPRALAWWLAQLILNGVWSWLFFGLKSPGLALMGICLLLAALFGTIHWFKRIKLSAAAWLTPYLLWLVFAAALNCSIWWLNGGSTGVLEFLHMA